MSQMRLPASAIVIAAAFGIGSPAAAETVTGRASVIDGDTLEIRGERLCLQSVDTPESAQVCSDGGGKDYP
jgi:endonuclease YncB( thermonuclease family)